jgi:plastocyanin
MHNSAFRSLFAVLAFVGIALFASNSVEAASQSATVGQTVTFSVTADGTAPFAYQWSKGGVAIPGATSMSYVITNVQLADAGTYNVVVSNSAGSATSDDAVLTVNAAPAFTTQPASQTVTAGTAVTFTSAASGSPAPTFQWQKNGTNVTGATSASYTIASTVTTDAGTYTVVATNVAGSATSTNAVLTVNLPTVPPAFTTQPASQTVTAGAAVTFTSAASGSPAPTFQWKKNGTNISGATSASYTIASAATADAGTYTVVATNTVGSATSSNAMLTVNAAPAFTTQPVSQTVNAGTAVTFTAAASGSPSPTYQWKKNGTNITGATGASYTIAGVAAADAGTYTVVATNTAGSATSSNAVLTVITPPGGLVVSIQVL